MCGIAGFYNNSGRVDDSASSDVSKMASSMNHRGPDDSGIWMGKENKIAFSHQRLSVIDISEAGHQPMLSSSQRYVITFNGEIYNFRDIKNLLKGVPWRGESDTEVLLEAIEQWGLEKALNYCEGMFAFALWDKELEKLSLVRDRLGEKPLYYGWFGDTFLFGSELKSLKAHPSFLAEIDMEAVTLYFNHGYIPAPSSIYSGIKKLLPGNILYLSPNSSDFKKPIIKKYWSLGDTVSEDDLEGLLSTEYSDELESRLIKAVTQQSIADVPLGSFLSGGIDSSLITAILQRHSDEKIQSFSLGFNEDKYNEAQYAKSVADHIGTVHHELIVTPYDMQNIIPGLAEMFDEPFGDPSAIPTHIVSKFARSDVTVALTGDGGDELFGGYNHYHRSAQIWSSIKKIPIGIRHLSSSMMKPFNRYFSTTSIGRKAERLSHYLYCDNLIDCYKVQTQASRFELNSLLDNSVNIKELEIPDEFQDYQAMMYADAMTYLPDDILVKVDRAAMSVSLETRAPFLNHHVVDFAFKLPLPFKIDHGSGKLILKDLLAKYMPRNLFERPKMGFGLPIDDWLRGSLREWAEDLLSEESLNNISFLNGELVRSRWHEHLNNIHDWHYFLWDVLMFVEWYKKEDF